MPGVSGGRGCSSAAMRAYVACGFAAMSAATGDARRGLRIENDGAGPRLASWATYLGFARNEIERGPAWASDGDANRTDARRDRRAARSRNGPRARRA